MRCKVFKVGNDIITDAEGQTAALNPLQGPYGEEGAFTNQHLEAKLLQSQVLKVAGKILTDYSELI